MSLNDNDGSARLRFLGIDAETRGHLKEFWSVAQPALPGILAAFYQHAGTEAGLAKLVGNDVSRLQKAQSLHWERLFSGRFDDDYFSSAHSIGVVHNRVGLEPRWYIGGYAFLLNAMTDLAVTSYRWKSGKLSAVLRALNRAVMLDMDLVISVYKEALLADRAQRGKKIDALTLDFETNASAMVHQVSDAAATLQATAQSLTGTAGQASQRSTSIAAAAEQASANVQTAAAAAEELAASISEISRQVAHSARIAGKARDDAARTDSVVQALADGAQKIGQVVGLISDIAGQTNLLALNATIEAARAGDAGKGFAVVASEVKSLATQTAKATQDIAGQIEQIQSTTREAVASIQGIGSTIKEISEIASAIAAAVEEQGSATQDIARNVQQAAAGTMNVTVNVTGVSQGVNDTGAAASQVLEAAGMLSRQANQLQGAVTHYIAGVKAA